MNVVRHHRKGVPNIVPECLGIVVHGFHKHLCDRGLKAANA